MKESSLSGCRRILVLGAARSGKSVYAQRLAEKLSRNPLFIATSEIIDEEMKKRVAAHRKTRGKQWRCIEEPLDIASVIRSNQSGGDVMLVDCVTVWLGNVLHREDKRAFARRSRALIEAFRTTRRPVIMVANEVGMGIVPENELGRVFRDLAGRLNQQLAAEADAVVFVVAGLPMALKGNPSC